MLILNNIVKVIIYILPYNKHNYLGFINLKINFNN